jgi:hypothetical protein
LLCLFGDAQEIPQRSILFTARGAGFEFSRQRLSLIGRVQSQRD